MNVQELEINGCFVLEHKVFPDERGLFREWFKGEETRKLAPSFEVQQANFSISKRGVIRGIHYSLAPKGQSKLVSCAQGGITDVLVDLRKGSPSYLKVEYVHLSEESGRTVFIASGVGHGFIVETESAAVVYLTSSAYASQFEKAICPTDPALAIHWPLPDGIGHVISPADASAPTLVQADAAGDLPNFSVGQ
jgi:dTDP-4-dehydrorhamnose 3,5-epimerase